MLIGPLLTSTTAKTKVLMRTDTKKTALRPKKDVEREGYEYNKQATSNIRFPKKIFQN